MRLGAESAGPQTSNDLDAAAAEGPKTIHGELKTVQDIGSSVINGAQIILNQSSMPS